MLYSPGHRHSLWGQWVYLWYEMSCSVKGAHKPFLFSFYCCDSNWPWKTKGFISVYWLWPVVLEGSQGRISSRSPKQKNCKPWRNAAWWPLAGPHLDSFLYSLGPPARDGATHSGLDPPASFGNEGSHHRHIHRTICSRQSLNWDFLLRQLEAALSWQLGLTRTQAPPQTSLPWHKTLL